MTKSVIAFQPESDRNVLRDQTLGEIKESGHYVMTESSNQFFFLQLFL